MKWHGEDCTIKFLGIDDCINVDNPENYFLTLQTLFTDSKNNQKNNIRSHSPVKNLESLIMF